MHRGVLRAAEQTAAYFGARPTIVRELDELREVLEDRVGLAGQVVPVPEWPLALHRHYSRREIAAGVGYVAAGAKLIKLQSGILKLEDQRRELLFVTLDKSGKSFSPTTRYRDYASSPDTLPLGDPGRRQRRPALGPALRRERDQRLAVLPVRAPRSGRDVRVPRADHLRGAHRRSPDRDHLAARDPDARRALRALRDPAAGLSRRGAPGAGAAVTARGTGTTAAGRRRRGRRRRARGGSSASGTSRAPAGPAAARCGARRGRTGADRSAPRACAATPRARPSSWARAGAARRSPGSRWRRRPRAGCHRGTATTGSAPGRAPGSRARTRTWSRA